MKDAIQEKYSEGNEAKPTINIKHGNLYNIEDNRVTKQEGGLLNYEIMTCNQSRFVPVYQIVPLL